MTAQSEQEKVIFDDRPAWKPGVFFWFLVIMAGSIILGGESPPIERFYLIINVVALFAIFGYLRSLRGRTILTEKELIVHRGLFLITKYSFPLADIEKVEVREPWLFKGGILWRLMDSYGHLDIYTKERSLIPWRADNMKRVHDKARLINERLARIGS